MISTKPAFATLKKLVDSGEISKHRAQDIIFPGRDRPTQRALWSHKENLNKSDLSTWQINRLMKYTGRPFPDFMAEELPAKPTLKKLSIVRPGVIVVWWTGGLVHFISTLSEHVTTLQVKENLTAREFFDLIQQNSNLLNK